MTAVIDSQVKEETKPEEVASGTESEDEPSGGEEEIDAATKEAQSKV